jgi:ABC-type sugar transport system permease subunit
VTRARTRRGGAAARRADAVAGYAFIAPALVGFTAFVAYPLVRSGYLSLTEWNGIADPVFVGLDNYRTLVTADPSFWPSVRATLLLVVLYVPASLVLGLVLAVFANQRYAGVRWLRTACYLPVVLPVVATITLWKFVFNPQVGLANSVLQALGLPRSLWLSDPATAMPSVVIVMLWGVGSTMVIFLAALQAVPRELHEAAAVDGATGAQRFLRVTLPAISPIMLLQLVLQLTTALQTFNQPKILTQNVSGGAGGPEFATNVLMLSIYEDAFGGLGTFPRLGYASAQVWVLFTGIVLVVALSARILSRWTLGDRDVT